jgi:hypothetical protein
MTEEWKNRIYNYEVKPSAKAWEKITSALDDSCLSDQFPALLHDMAVAPPGSAWEKISAQLNEDIPARAIYRRIPSFVRYAAAAAAIVLIAFGGIQFLKNHNSIKTESPPVTKIDTPLNNTDKEIQSLQTEQDILDNLALEESKKTMATLDVEVNRNRMTAYQNYINPIETEMETFAVTPQDTYRDLDYADMMEPLQAASYSDNMAKRYIMLITPDGNIIRMSKKLGDLVCCVSGEEQDDECKSQLDKWRSKILSAQIHSSGNFMDILNLVNSLQSNNH